MKPYGIQQLGIYYRDKRGVEIPAPDKKEREELAEVDESDIFDEAIVIERNEPGTFAGSRLFKSAGVPLFPRKYGMGHRACLP